MDDIGINTLLGKTLTDVRINKIGTHNIRFITSDGGDYVMYHYQDCSESVGIEDIIGDVDDLIGSPILEAEEVCSEENPDSTDPYDSQFTCTWTFYKLGTRKGRVTLRWLGESNGYYSERVTFCETKDAWGYNH